MKAVNIEILLHGQGNNFFEGHYELETYGYCPKTGKRVKSKHQVPVLSQKYDSPILLNKKLEIFWSETNSKMFDQLVIEKQGLATVMEFLVKGKFKEFLGAELIITGLVMWGENSENELIPSRITRLEKKRA